jgi:hypothetical protein
MLALAARLSKHPVHMQLGRYWVEIRIQRWLTMSCSQMPCLPWLMIVSEQTMCGWRRYWVETRTGPGGLSGPLRVDLDRRCVGAHGCPQVASTQMRAVIFYSECYTGIACVPRQAVRLRWWLSADDIAELHECPL